MGGRVAFSGHILSCAPLFFLFKSQRNSAAYRKPETTVKGPPDKKDITHRGGRTGIKERGGVP